VWKQIVGLCRLIFFQFVRRSKANESRRETVSWWLVITDDDSKTPGHNQVYFPGLWSFSEATYSRTQLISVRLLTGENWYHDIDIAVHVWHKHGTSQHALYHPYARPYWARMPWKQEGTGLLLATAAQAVYSLYGLHVASKRRNHVLLPTDDQNSFTAILGRLLVKAIVEHLTSYMHYLVKR